MLLGTAITLQDKNQTLYVEYHQCDQCQAEYRVYLKSPGSVEEAFQKIAKMMGNKLDKPDLCYHCQNQVINTQVMLPIQV